MEIENKFRIWNGREMVYDITVGKFGTFYVNPENGNGLNPNDTNSMSVNTTKYHKDVIVMKFAGQEDDNETEIYMGDILSTKWRAVVFQNEEGTFMIKFANNPSVNKPMSLRKYLNRRFKAGTSERDNVIIGNVFANPELLKQ